MKTTIIITMAVLTVVILVYVAYEIAHAYTPKEEDEDPDAGSHTNDTLDSETKSSKEGEE